LKARTETRAFLVSFQQAPRPNKAAILEPHSSATGRRRGFFRDGIAVEIGLHLLCVLGAEVQKELVRLLAPAALWFSMPGLETMPGFRGRRTLHPPHFCYGGG